MEISDAHQAAIARQHLRRARYYRAMALSASTLDVARSFLLLALHHEGMARMPASVPSPLSSDRHDLVPDFSCPDN
jgi:hypothetical protein